jgi:hypothetical protein
MAALQVPRAKEASDWLVLLARLKLALLDAQILRELRLVASHLLDEALGVLAADVDLERVAERELRREPAVDDAVDEHPSQRR